MEGRMVEVRGGGHRLNAMTYDPEYNRIYVGTGNGGPRNAKLQPLAVGTTCFVFSRRA